MPSGSYAVFRRRPAYTIGDIILAEHERLGTIVKEIVSEDAHGFRLRGLHHQSTSTQTMGSLPVDRILGKLVWTIKSPASQTASAN